MPRPRIILALIALLAVLPAPGCRSPGAGEDPAVLRAEQALEGAFRVVDAFLRWEYNARTVPTEVRATAELLREHFPAAHRAAANALIEWKRSRSRDDYDRLTAALQTLGRLADLAAQYLPQP